MGGYGSGNWRRKQKTTSDFPSIDIRLLQRRDFLNPGHTHVYESVYESYTESINIKTEYDQLIVDYCYQFGKNKFTIRTIHLRLTGCLAITEASGLSFHALCASDVSRFCIV